MPINVNSWEAKVDYTNKLNDWLKLEAGYNGNYSHENTPNTTMRLSPDGTLKTDESLFNRFIYSNNVSALYVTLGGKIKDFSFSACPALQIVKLEGVGVLRLKFRISI